MTQIPKVTLPKLLEISEKPLLPNDATNPIILQPKFDGCQAILIPGHILNRPERYLAITRKGQVIHRLQTVCTELPKDLNQLLFCEYEPVPWTETAKVKLSGNLYTDTPLPFDTRLVVFDACTPKEFLTDKHRKGNCKERLLRLENLRETLSLDGDVPIYISPWKEMPYAEAKHLCSSSNHSTPEGTRCKVLDTWCEGGVIRFENKAEKVKAKEDADVIVLRAVTSAKGQRGWIVADTKDISNVYPVFGGVPRNHNAYVGQVVEVVKLIVTGFKGAGNPTFTRSRDTEKAFDPAGVNPDLITHVATKHRLTIQP